jgi:hypothetical protein
MSETPKEIPRNEHEMRIADCSHSGSVIQASIIPGRSKRMNRTNSTPTFRVAEIQIGGK